MPNVPKFDPHRLFNRGALLRYAYAYNLMCVYAPELASLSDDELRNAIAAEFARDFVVSEV